MQRSFDYIIIGGGSGGLASARRAAAHGASVAIVELDRLGGTCVIRGCVPKKVTYNLASLYETVNTFPSRYGFKNCERIPDLDYYAFKTMRDAYVTRLSGIFHRNIERENVMYYSGFARFLSSKCNHPKDEHVIEVLSTEGTVITEISAKYILVASGGQPYVPENIPGAREHGITSDGFFELDNVPKHAVVVGAGYIAVEICGILCTLGSKVELLVRGTKLLRGFDESLQIELEKHMLKAGVKIHYSANASAVSKNPNTGQFDVQYDVHDSENTSGVLKNRSIDSCNVVIFATGRSPATKGLQLPELVQFNALGHILVDKFQNTGESRVFALGDVCGRAELTPVAISAGRHLANRLFGGEKYAESFQDYEKIPTVVFSHPPIGTVGMTEKEANEQFPNQVKVYTSTFINMIYSMAGTDPSAQVYKPTSFYKLVTVGKDEKVVGIHIIGHNSDEIIQGFAVALKLGARKSDFDTTVAIHPTASEELVTMQ